MRLPRAWGLAGTMMLLMVSAPLTLVAEPPPLSILYNDAVYGDAAMVGSPAIAQRPSTGAVAIPAGARIAYATLGWSGAVGGQCGDRPPGSPRAQPVSVTVGGRTSRLLPERYTEDDLFYGARANLTGMLASVSGRVPVTVGNVWTPTGCAGGWSVVAVWMFDAPHAPNALARKQITVYSTHLRLSGGDFGVHARPAGLRPAGGDARIGVIAYGGDRALPGDRFLVDGRDPDGTGNFFVSDVDARWVRVPAAPTELTFSSGLDSYLVAGIVVVTPMPGLTAVTEVDRPATHTGDEVTQTVRVTNPGGAPLLHVTVRGDTGCVREIGQLDGGRTATVRCARTASARPSARVTGESLLGERFTAEAVTSMEVLRPGIAVRATAAPATVLKGQQVDHEITVRNTGNAALSTVVTSGVSACTGELGSLAAGAERVVRCAGPAEGPVNVVRAVGTDKLGLRVTAEAEAVITVVVPRVILTVTPSTSAARPGDSITFMINVKNATTLALQGIRVTGSPSECARDLGTLAPDQTVSYNCTVTVTDRLTVDLSVGSLAHAVVIVSVVPGNPPPLPPPAARRAAVVAETPEPVPLAALIGGLAVLSNLVMVGGFAATACRSK